VVKKVMTRHGDILRNGTVLRKKGGRKEAAGIKNEGKPETKSGRVTSCVSAIDSGGTIGKRRRKRKN